jgi:Tol biopolymer transport system component
VFDRLPAGDGGGGVIAFVRTLRGCPNHPNVPGPQGAVFAVSPNGRREWNLSEAVALDGSPTTLNFSPDGTRFAWVDRYRDDLWLTDLVTGTTQRLTRGLAVAGPRFSPDGSRIVFKAGKIHIVNADGSGLTPLTEGETPTWTPDGRIAYLRTQHRIEREKQGDGTLIHTIPLPTEFFLMNADGTGIEKVFEAPGEINIIEGEWSPDGTKLVGEAVQDENHDIYVVSIEERDVLRLTTVLANDTSPSWSPDGTRIAFHTDRFRSGEGQTEIMVMNAGGGGLTRLTDDCWVDVEPTWVENDGAIAALPTWSPPPRPDLGEPTIPTGDQILFADVLEGVEDIWAIDPDGRNLVNVTASLPSDSNATWSPDRTKIAFSSDRDDSGSRVLYVMDVSNGDVVMLLPGLTAERPEWSPDGSSIAFESNGDILVTGADGSDLQQLTGGTPRNSNPTWAPDGRHIAFSRASSREGESEINIYSIELDGSPIDQLTRGGRDYEPDWSPDGERIVFTRDRNLYVMNADGTGERLLIGGGGGGGGTYERGADWSPDGTRIVFASNRDGGTAMRLYIADADGSDVTRLSDEIGFCCPEPDW